MYVSYIGAIFLPKSLSIFRMSLNDLLTLHMIAFNGTIILITLVLGARVKRASLWLTRGCANSIKPVLCITVCAW